MIAKHQQRGPGSRIVHRQGCGPWDQLTRDEAAVSSYGVYLRDRNRCLAQRDTDLRFALESEERPVKRTCAVVASNDESGLVGATAERGDPGFARISTGDLLETDYVVTKDLREPFSHSLISSEVETAHLCDRPSATGAPTRTEGARVPACTLLDTSMSQKPTLPSSRRTADALYRVEAMHREEDPVDDLTLNQERRVVRVNGSVPLCCEGAQAVRCQRDHDIDVSKR